jgi:hypothetical protein
LLPVIGSLYGVGSPLAGWVSHLFHSVVFGLLYAAGVVMPLWLQFVGIEATVPNTTLPGIVSHIVWGRSSAACTRFWRADRVRRPARERSPT